MTCGITVLKDKSIANEMGEQGLQYREFGLVGRSLSLLCLSPSGRINYSRNPETPHTGCENLPQ